MAAAAAAAAASAATQAIAHSTLARYAVLCVGVALPLLFFALAVARSQKFRRELWRDPFHVLHRGEDMIVAALGDDTNLKSLARALMHSLLLPLFAIAVLVVVADEFTERDLVSEVFDYAHQLLHIHPYVTTAAVVGVPSAITGMLHSIAQNASIAHGLSFQKHDVVDFPQLPGLSKPDASPPGLLVVDIEALDHHRVKLVRRCDELVVRLRAPTIFARRRCSRAPRSADPFQSHTGLYSP